MKKMIYAATLLVALIACNEDPVTPETNNPTPTTPPPATTSYFVSFTMDGTDYSYSQGQNNYYGAMYPGGSFNGGAEPAIINTGAGLMKLNDDMAPIAKIAFFEYTFNPGSVYFNDKSGSLASITAAGSRNFTTSGSGNPGVRFDFYPLGEYGYSSILSSSNGSQNNNASFQVTSSVDKTDILDIKREVSGTFACTIYDENGNGAKNVTNGKFKLIFSTY